MAARYIGNSDAKIKFDKNKIILISIISLMLCVLFV